MKKRVLVFTTSYWPRMGGSEVAVREVATRLASDHEFYIITARTDRALPQVEHLPECTIVRVGFGTRFDKWLLPIWGAVVGRRYVCERVVLWGIDISHGALAATLLKRMCSHVPLILNIQYGYGEDRLRVGRFGLLNLAFRFMLSKANYVTAISTYLRDIVVRFGYRGKIEIVPNGVDISKFQPATNYPDSEVVTLITTSRLVKKNAVEDIIEALKFLPENVILKILGSGEEERYLKQKVIQFNLQKRVEFFGYQPHEKMIEYIQGAQIFVRPSVTEGLGNSFLEAMALGVPVVGTRSGGIADFLHDGKTGWVVGVHDPHGIANAVLNITNLESRHVVRDITQSARELILKRYNWDTIAPKFAEVFESA